MDKEKAVHLPKYNGWDTDTKVIVLMAIIASVGAGVFFYGNKIFGLALVGFAVCINVALALLHRKWWQK